MFIKLNKNIHIDNYQEKEKVISYGGKIGYSTVSSIPFRNIYSIIPLRYRNKFRPLVMKITANVGPHTDSGIRATINIYLEPDDCVTNFYKIPTETRVDVFQVPNQTNGRAFNPKQLILYDSFTAKKDEVWLLDVTKPHSVISNKSSVNRTAIVLQTNDYSYEQVKEMLKETGCL